MVRTDWSYPLLTTKSFFFKFDTRLRNFINFSSLNIFPKFSKEQRFLSWLNSASINRFEARLKAAREERKRGSNFGLRARGQRLVPNRIPKRTSSRRGLAFVRYIESPDALKTLCPGLIQLRPKRRCGSNERLINEICASCLSVTDPEHVALSRKYLEILFSTNY